MKTLTSAEAASFLAVRSHYRVLKPFLGYVAGDELELFARLYDPHNAAWIWSFRRVGDGCAGDLTELADDDVPIIKALEAHLAPL